MPNPETFTVGLIQMHCSPDPDDNLRRAEEKVRAAARQGAQMVCLPELFRTQYFCQRENTALFDLAEPLPGPTTEALSIIARENKIVIVTLSLSGARVAFITTPPPCLTPMEAPGVFIAKCTSLTILFTTRNYYHSGRPRLQGL